MSEKSYIPALSNAEVNGNILATLTGQGDRHAHNYLIDVREDLTVTVTGIDNDQCFTGYRTGAQTYVIKDRYAERFQEAREETIAKYPAYMRDVVQKRFEADPGVTILPGGSIRLEPTLFKSQELHYATRQAVGMHGASMPDFIDAELFDSLVALKAGPGREAYLADLSRRLPPEAIASATARLDESIAHAEKLHAEGKVIAADDFAKADVQKRILARDLATSGANPIAPIGSHQLDDKDVVAAALRQNLSLFGRDLMRKLDRGLWRA